MGKTVLGALAITGMLFFIFIIIALGLATFLLYQFGQNRNAVLLALSNKTAAVAAEVKKQYQLTVKTQRSADRGCFEFVQNPCEIASTAILSAPPTGEVTITYSQIVPEMPNSKIAFIFLGKVKSATGQQTRFRAEIKDNNIFVIYELP